ncbi:hypothetical protein GGR91_002084 [Sphingorhabdus rigui]|uniref:Uncharacterized protein n=1 Tax=Sphingorhabdus rigui TaxID=1282858 RepID=A0A840B4K6_9SPHN|nr:hypothetical protein [Sphingorhabdus rigui]MBB3943820.1 hypothetical protein [Sphingorhabdus rigui]
MAAAGMRKPLDVLLSDIDFLNEYLLELSERFRSEGNTEEAERANDWAMLTDEITDRLSE